MSYVMTSWQDAPSNSTPLTAENLLPYNAAINDLDVRVAAAQAVMVITGAQTGNYTALVNQFVPVDTTTTSVTISLPSAPPDLSRVGAKHIIRGGLNIVTMATSGTDTFNKTTGPTAVTLSGVNQAAIFQYVAATGVWMNISDDTPLTTTTARAIAMSMVLGAFSP